MTLTFTMTLTFPMTLCSLSLFYILPSILQSFQEIHPSSLFHSKQNTPALTDHGLFVTDNIYLFCLTPIYRVQMLEIIGVYPLMQNDRNTQPTTRAMNYRMNSRTGQFMGGLLVQFKCDWCCVLICLNLISCEFLLFTRGVIIDILVFY